MSISSENDIKIKHQRVNGVDTLFFVHIFTEMTKNKKEIKEVVNGMFSYRTFILMMIVFGISIFIYSYYDNSQLKLVKHDVVETGVRVLAQNATRENDIQLLARCVNGEARGEPYIGQVAVAAVILNRVKHPSFPNTLAGVIYQPGAFTAVQDGQINVPIDPNSTVYKACTDAMNGWDPSEGAIYYYNPAKTTNKWIYSREVIKTIGKHVFAK